MENIVGHQHLTENEIERYALTTTGEQQGLLTVDDLQVIQGRLCTCSACMNRYLDRLTEIENAKQRAH